MKEIFFVKGRKYKKKASLENSRLKETEFFIQGRKQAREKRA
jgi:hypothetical protein